MTHVVRHTFQEIECSSSENYFIHLLHTRDTYIGGRTHFGHRMSSAFQIEKEALIFGWKVGTSYDQCGKAQDPQIAFIKELHNATQSLVLGVQEVRGLEQLLHLFSHLSKE